MAAEKFDVGNVALIVDVYSQGDNALNVPFVGLGGIFGIYFCPGTLARHRRKCGRVSALPSPPVPICVGSGAFLIILAGKAELQTCQGLRVHRLAVQQVRLRKLQIATRRELSARARR